MTEPDESTPETPLPDPEAPTWQAAVMVLTITLAWILLLYFILDKMSLTKPVSLFYETIGMFMPALIWAGMSKFRFTRVFRFQYPGWRHLLLAIPIGVGASVIIDAIDRWWSLVLPPNPAYLKDMMDTLHWNSMPEFIMVAAGVALFAPLVEEMLFRGMLQGALEDRSGAASAVLWTAAVFSFFHFNFSQLLTLFLLSLILGFMAWRVDSILPGIVIHSMNNSLSLSTLNKPDGELFPGYLSGHFIAIPVLLVAVVITAIAGYAYFRFTDTVKLEPTV